MPVPRSLNQWDLDAVRQLVANGYHEDDSFDFKAVLTSRDSNHADVIRKAACSFANGRGGFLVFGVAEQGDGEDRIVGIPDSRENAKYVSDKLLNAEPSLDFAVGNPPIHLEVGKSVILVVEIPRGRRGPHRDKDGQFWIRSAGTARRMTYVEIQQAFANYDERVRRVHLVFLSLADNWFRLSEMAKCEQLSKASPALVPDSSQLRQHLSEVNLICPEATQPILTILQMLDVISFHCSIQLGLANSALPEKHLQLRAGNRAIADAVTMVKPAFEEAMGYLMSRFGFQPVHVSGEDIPPIKLPIPYPFDV